MATRISAATERALAHVAAGESAYAAARAEGIALSAIYRALRKPGEATYAYDMGAVFGEIYADHRDKITTTAMGCISMRPDLMRVCLRHLDLTGYDIPPKPDGWRPSLKAKRQFWLGYYHSRHHARRPEHTKTAA